MLTKYLSVFFISMVPLIELRGAIPVGVAMGLPLWQGEVTPPLGQKSPRPFIFFFARKVLEWGADKPVIGKFFTFCLEKGHKGGAKLKATAAPGGAGGGGGHASAGAAAFGARVLYPGGAWPARPPGAAYAVNGAGASYLYLSGPGDRVTHLLAAFCCAAPAGCV